MRYSSTLLLRFTVFLSAVALLGFPAAAFSRESSDVSAGGPAGGSGARCSFRTANATGDPLFGSIEAIDCAVGAPGNYSLSASASADHGTLRSAAQMALSDVSGSGGRTRGQARAQSSFTDNITLDAPGRTGEVVDLVFQSALTGTSSALVDGLGSDGQAFQAFAGGLLRVRVAGSSYEILDTFDSRTGLSRTEVGSNTAQITLGQSFSISAVLTANTFIQQLGGPLSFNTIILGDAVAPFGSSGGPTSFELFDLSGQPIPDFTLTSASGDFRFFVVPEPSTGLLVMGGMMGLGFLRRSQMAS